jgi:hypothetical protein
MARSQANSQYYFVLSQFEVKSKPHSPPLGENGDDMHLFKVKNCAISFLWRCNNAKSNLTASSCHGPYRAFALIYLLAYVQKANSPGKSR